MYYPAEFPYYPQYYHFNNCMSKNTYNAGLTQQQKPNTGISQSGLGLASTKQSGRKLKESSGGSNSLPNSLQQSSAQGTVLNVLAGIDRNEPRDPEHIKQHMIQWLKSLDIDQRFEVFLVKDKWFAQTIVKMFWKQKLSGDSAFSLYTEEDTKERNKNNHRTFSELDQQFYCRRWAEQDNTSASSRARKKAESDIINAVRVLDDKEFYDSLAFDKDYLDTSIEQLIHSFDVISDNNFFSTSHFCWFNPRSFQTIATWIVSQFEKILQQKFLEDRSRFNQKATRIALSQEQQQVPLLESKYGSSNLHTGSKISANSLGLGQSDRFHQETLFMTANASNKQSQPQQSQPRRRSYQENTNHYDNLLRYWRSLSESRRKKVLQKCCEIKRDLETKSSKTSNNNNISSSKNTKHTQMNQVVLEHEWYCKVRETFYQSKDKSINSNTNNTISNSHTHMNGHANNPPSSTLNPNQLTLSLSFSDDDLLNEIISYSDDTKCETFISQLCFTALSHTTSLTTLILKEIHVKLNEMYAESIEQSLILHDELDKKKKTSMQQLVHSSAGVPAAQAAKKKNKKSTGKNESQSHSNIINQKKIKGDNNITTVSGSTTSSAVVMITQQQQQQTNNRHHHNTNNNKTNSSNNNNNNKNKKDIKSLINSCSAVKEPSFAEEVQLMYEQEQKEEKEAKQREIDMKLALEKERLEQAEKEKQLELLIESKTNKIVKDKKKKGKNNNGDKKEEIKKETLGDIVKKGNEQISSKGKKENNEVSQKQDSNKIKNSMSVNQNQPTNANVDKIDDTKIIHQGNCNSQKTSQLNKIEKQIDCKANAHIESKNITIDSTTIVGKSTKEQGNSSGRDKSQNKKQEQSTAVSIRNDNKQIDQKVDCCDQALRCEMAEISRAIVIKLIQQCVAGLEDNQDHINRNKHKGNHSNNNNSQDVLRQDQNEMKRQDITKINEGKEELDVVNVGDSGIHQIKEENQDIQLSSIPKTKKKSKNKKKSNGNNNKNESKGQQDQQDQNTDKPETAQQSKQSIDKQEIIAQKELVIEQIEEKEELNIIDKNNNTAVIPAVIPKNNYLRLGNYNEQHDDDSDFIQVGTKKKNKPAQVTQQPQLLQIGTAINNNNNSRKHKNNNSKITQNNSSKVSGLINQSQNNHMNNKQKLEGEQQYQIVNGINSKNNINQSKNTIPHRNETHNNSKNDTKQIKNSNNIQTKKDNLGNNNSNSTNNNNKSMGQPQVTSKKNQTLQYEQNQLGYDNNKHQISIINNPSHEVIPDQAKGKQQQQQQQQINNSNNRSNKHVVSNQGDRGCVVVLSNSQNNNNNNNNNNNKSTASSLSHSSSSYVPMLNTIDLHRDCDQEDDGDESDSQMNYIQNSSRRNGVQDRTNNNNSKIQMINDVSNNRLPNYSVKPSLSPSSCSSFASLNSHEFHSASVSIKNNNDSSPKAKNNQTFIPLTKNTSSFSMTPNKTPDQQPQQQLKSSLPIQQSPPVLASKLKAKIAKRLFRKKITHDIVSFSERINSESHRYQPSRQTIFLRIQKILKQLYSGQEVDVRIFGSCATGLSLPTSDIDIGITGFERNSKRELIGVLGNLANVLESFSWVKSVERIFTASIPIIKIEVDPLVEFSARNGGMQYEELNKLIEDSYEDSYFELNMQLTDTPNDLQGMRLKVDITVECQVSSSATSGSSSLEKLNHLGVLSTDFVTRWMSYYTKLQPMTILMKCFLYTRNLNTNFKGGISSYSLLIMIIAFFRENQSVAQSDDFSNILISFLKFYGCQFNPENTGVSLVNQNPFFSVVRSPGQSKLQVIDPLMGKLLTSNTYLIDEILKEFEGFHKYLLEFNKKCEKQLDKLTAKDLLFIDSVSYSELLSEMKKQAEQQNLSDHTTEKDSKARNFKDLREFLLPNQIESVIYEVDEQKHEFFDRIFKAQQSQSSFGIRNWFDVQRNNIPLNNQLSQSPPIKNLQQYKDM